MNKIWAPWRMQYIENVDKDDGCFMCDILTETEDRKNLILYRGKEAYVVMNRYPYNSGHLMVIPNEHTKDIMSVSSSCRDEIMQLVAKSMKVLEEKMGSQGFNCGMNFGRIAGAGIEDHFHMHIVPRWSGDTNFFPVLGKTKSMPEYLEETYDRIVDGFKGGI